MPKCPPILEWPTYRSKFKQNFHLSFSRVSSSHSCGVLVLVELDTVLCLSVHWCRRSSWVCRCCCGWTPWTRTSYPGSPEASPLPSSPPPARILGYLGSTPVWSWRRVGRGSHRALRGPLQVLHDAFFPSRSLHGTEMLREMPPGSAVLEDGRDWNSLCHLQ